MDAVGQRDTAGEPQAQGVGSRIGASESITNSGVITCEDGRLCHDTALLSVDCVGIDGELWVKKDFGSDLEMGAVWTDSFDDEVRIDFGRVGEGEDGGVAFLK